MAGDDSVNKNRPERRSRSVRACVFSALTKWEETSHFASDILDEMIGDENFKPLDRALARELFFGVIRNLYYLDAVISQLRERGKVKRSAKNLLRLGLYQIFFTRIASHAAVNETVSVARRHERALVNAILRNAIRRKEEIVASSEKWSWEDRYSHPQFLIDRWTRQHGASAAEDLCRWNNQPPPLYARVHDPTGYSERLNRVQSDSDSESDSESDSDSGVEELERFPGFVELSRETPLKEWIDSGSIYIQDPSTSLACNLLAPGDGECVLDACAAPGGKTALLAAMSRDYDVRIVATDSNPARLDLLRDNLSRLGLKDKVEVSQMDWEKTDSDAIGQFPKFDAILLDVPCSNSGVMRRRIDARWRLQPGDFARLASRQRELIKNVAQCLKPGGRIVYSTCSVDREENEEVIESIEGYQVEEVVVSLPWRDGFDGAFAARLRKVGMARG